MIKSVAKIKNISLIEQNQDEEIKSLKEFNFDDLRIGSGAFGTVYRITSINGNESDKFVVKIFEDELNQEHAYNTISLLHNKIKKHIKKTKLPIYNEYPELLGLPFAAFKGFDEIEEKNIIGFLMFDLRRLGFEDYGSDKNSKLLSDVDYYDRFLYSYQLSKVISFLHGNKFIHADISANAVWINKTTKQLAIIDFDSGFHYTIQEKPSTIGKLTHWIGAKFYDIIKNTENDEIGLKVKDRIFEENWVLANALFEIIFGFTPYFFLNDVDDKKKYLKKNEWPNIDFDSNLFNTNNKKAYLNLINLLNGFEQSGFVILIDNFRKTFNKGFRDGKERLTTKEWKDIFFNICTTLEKYNPEITNFYSDKEVINNIDEEVTFSWESKFAKSVYLDGKLMPLFSNNKSIAISDVKTVELELINDFGPAKVEITIDIHKILPEIEYFRASSKFRENIDPIELQWKVKDAIKVRISSIEESFNSEDSVEVEPTNQTDYVLTAIGNFNDTVSSTISVDVVKPKIEHLSATINIEHGIDNVDISWTTTNAKNVTIEPFVVGHRPASGMEHVTISETTEFTLTAIGLFAQEVKKIKVSPFPAPQIESIYTEIPHLEMNFAFDFENLKIPKELIELDRIHFNNNISLDKSFVELETLNMMLSTPKFVDNNKLLELYKKEHISLKQILDKIKHIIYTKLHQHEAKRNN